MPRHRKPHRWRHRSPLAGTVSGAWELQGCPDCGWIRYRMEEDGPWQYLRRVPVMLPKGPGKVFKRQWLEEYSLVDPFCRPLPDGDATFQEVES